MKSFPGEKNIPANDKRRLLVKAIYDTRLDTLPILDNMQYYDEACTGGDTAYGILTPLDSNIHVLDVNADGQDDLVFHCNHWGFGLQFAYIFINRGDSYSVIDLPGTVFLKAGWINKKMASVTVVDPACCTYPFHKIKNCAIHEKSVVEKETCYVYAYSWNHLKACKKSKSKKTTAKAVRLIEGKYEPGEDGRFRPEMPGGNVHGMGNEIKVKGKKYELLDTYNEYKFIVVRGENETYGGKGKINYYCGWTKDL